MSAAPAVESTAAPPPDTGPLAPLARATFVIAGSALVALVGVQAWQVLARYGFNDAPGWTEPTALLLLCTAMSLGAAGGVHQGAHFGFYVLREHARPALKRALEDFADGVAALLGGVLAYWGALLLLDGLGVSMAGAALPQSANYLPMSAGGALMLVFALDRIRRRHARAPEAER